MKKGPFFAAYQHVTVDRARNFLYVPSVLVFKGLLEKYILYVYTKKPMEKMSQFAKLFQNGSSQAVRLPREFRFKGDKVRIRRVGKSIVLEPLIDDPDAWLAELKNIPADPDFMKKRRQPKTPKRAIFK